MMRFVLPVLLALLGVGAGVGAGLALRSNADDAGADAPESAEETAGQDTEGAEAIGPGIAPAPDRGRPPIDEIEFVRLNDQFLVPVLRQGGVDALVVVSVSLEVRLGLRDVVVAREPKLRDAFLGVMFDHANAGGFDGTFTSGPRMSTLRQNLWEAARPILGPDVFDVLITDLVRQDR